MATIKERENTIAGRQSVGCSRKHTTEKKLTLVCETGDERCERGRTRRKGMEKKKSIDFIQYVYIAPFI
jgi:hypothetical protein